MTRMRKRSIPWILGFILIAVWLTTLSDQQVAAQDDDYIGPEACITCHQEKYDEWNESKHSEAYSDPEFQQEWSAAGKQEDCLQCHTTGYDQETKTYALEGVTCEQCHGPGLTMEVDRSSELCGSCHTGEYGKERYENYLKGTHANSGVTCANCHLSDANHSFEIQAQTCASCHTENRIHSSSQITDSLARALAAEDHASNIEAQVAELENELLAVEERTQFITQLTFIGGGGVFLVVLIVVLSYLRQKRS